MKVEEKKFQIELVYIITIILINNALIYSQQLEYLKSESISFSLKEFDKQLFISLNDSSVGWAYSIRKGEKIEINKYGGYKITPIDKVNNIGAPFTSDTKIHVASLSKPITALAIAKLIEMKKLNWDTKIKDVLPGSWRIHDLYSSTTIKDLYQMKSGLDGPLDQASSCLDTLKVLMERGPNINLIGKFNYQNTSYALFRLIIGFINKPEIYDCKIQEKVLSISSANSYESFIIENIFKPIKISNVACRILDSEPALQYPFPYNNEAGELTGESNLVEYAGGFGWYMSTYDALNLFSKLFNGKCIISDKTLSDLFEIGYPFRINKGKMCSYVSSGGDWGHPTDNGSWRGIHAYYFYFPDNIVMTCFLNSGDSPPTKKVLRCYENSFINK